MTVIDAVPGDTVGARFQIGSLHERVPNIYNIELVRPPHWQGLRVSLLAANGFETKKLFYSIDRWKPNVPSEQASPVPALKFSDYSSVELSGGGMASMPLRFNFAPGSSINYRDLGAEEITRIPFERKARLIESEDHHVEIEFNEGKVSGFPVLLKPAAQLKCILKITAPQDAKPGDSIKLRLLQRLATGRIAGGITVVVNVRKKK
jgi:hypothetical protein